jgi:DNA-binding CsgD family transcriptional regulator
VRRAQPPQPSTRAMLCGVAPRADDHGVTRRESEVWALVAEHLTNGEIAAQPYISERTVESHVASLLRKLGATDRRSLARRRQHDRGVRDRRGGDGQEPVGVGGGGRGHRDQGSGAPRRLLRGRRRAVRSVRPGDRRRRRADRCRRGATEGRRPQDLIARLSPDLRRALEEPAPRADVAGGASATTPRPSLRWCARRSPSLSRWARISGRRRRALRPAGLIEAG